MEILQLNNLPMPPTINSRLLVNRGRMIKSKSCREFDRAIQIYILKLKSSIYDYRRKVKEWIDIGYCLEVEFDFYWPKEKLISKDGIPKRLDCDSRIKSALDSVALIIDADDKYVIRIISNKKYHDKAWEYFSVKVKPSFWKDLEINEKSCANQNSNDDKQN